MAAVMMVVTMAGVVILMSSFTRIVEMMAVMEVTTATAAAGTFM